MSTNNLVLSLVLVLVTFGRISAQQSAMKILVMDLSGVVEYSAPGVKTGPAALATMVSPEGSLKLEEGSRALLLANGKPFEISTKGKFKVKELVDMTATAPGGFSFDGVFFRRLLSAFGIEENTDLAALPESAANEGAGFSPRPDSRVASATISFSWPAQDQVSSYTFELYDKALDSLVYSTTTTDPILDLDFAELELPEDQVYCYSTGEKVCFTYTGANGVTGLIRLLETSSKTYQASGAFLQTLMKAVGYERAGFYYDADLLYASLLETHPGHEVVKQLQASIGR